MSHAHFLLRMETVRKQALEAINSGESVNPYSEDETEYWVWELMMQKACIERQNNPTGI